MSVIRHWLASATGNPEPMRVVRDAADAQARVDAGWLVQGPFVPADELEGAVAALQEATEALQWVWRFSEDAHARARARAALASLGGIIDHDAGWQET